MPPGISDLARAYHAVVPWLAKHPTIFRMARRPVLRLAGHVGAVTVADPVLTEGMTLYHGGRPSFTMRAIADGTYEPETARFLRSQLGPGDVFVDIGAHVGYFSVLASQLVGRQGRVVAFEPDPCNLPYLRRNCLTNCGSSAAVEIEPRAVGITAARLKLWRDPHDTGSTSLVGRVGLDRTDAEVEVTSLDAWVSNQTFVRARVVKIDCEGGEIDVLRGMRSWCSRGLVEAIVIELNVRTLEAAKRSALSLIRELRSLGFLTIIDIRSGRVIRTRQQLAMLARESYFIPFNLCATDNSYHSNIGK